VADCSSRSEFGTPGTLRGTNPLLHDLVHETFTVADGTLEIPDRPGLGITVDEEFVRRHARD
jgi:L-alanine-DL-glutamate epimerase-like enolase superfamily enzyme